MKVLSFCACAGLTLLLICCNDSSFKGGSGIFGGGGSDNSSGGGGDGPDGADDGSNGGDEEHGSGGEGKGGKDNGGPGIPGGHFDLDTSIHSYPFGSGKTEHHVHEYDDKYDTIGVDFYKMIDEKFVDLREAVQDENKQFIIIVANSKLSPGGVLIMNNERFSVQNWQTKVENNDRPAYTLKTLQNFRIEFSKDKPISEQIVPTVTGRVVPNEAGPGGEYRNGALTIQALDASNYEIESQLGVSAVGKPGLIWEATIFWHFGK